MRKITKNICINPVTRYKIFLKKKEPETDYKFLAETLKKECMEKDARIKALEHQNQLLCSKLERIKEIASKMPEA